MAVTSNNPEVDSSASSSSVFENVGSFVSSFFPVARNQEEEEEESSEEEPKEEAEGGEEGGDDEEEEEEDEPEDVRDEIYASCEESKACAPAKHHFDECQTRVQEGKGYKGEDCIEEFFHLAHCAQECLAPKLFSKLV